MTYLDSLFNNVEDIQQTNDDGFIICGTKDNFGWQWSTSKQVFIIKTDALGNIEWEREFGDTTIADWGYSIQQTFDGGYIISAISEIIHEYIYAIYLIKIDENGNVTTSYNIPLSNLIYSDRKLLMIVDFLGRETIPRSNTPFIEI